MTGTGVRRDKAALSTGTISSPVTIRSTRRRTRFAMAKRTSRRSGSGSFKKAVCELCAPPRPRRCSFAPARSVEGQIGPFVIREASGELAPKADRGRSTPRRRLLGECHPEPRARLRAVKVMCRCSGCCFRTGRGWSVSGARPHIVKEEVDDESWCGLSADRTWRRYRGGQGVCPGGGRPGLRPYCDLRSCPRRRSCRQRTEVNRSL